MAALGKQSGQAFGSDAEVVVIGGGIVGTSIAYHLAKQGMKDVVLLEKTELGAQSTCHSAGGITSYHPASKQMDYYSVLLYSQLQNETGQKIFHRSGSIRLATSSDELDACKGAVQKEGDKAPSWLLTPEEIHKMCPVMEMNGVQGGLFTPVDGHLDTTSLTQALAAGARKYGAEIYMPVPVTDVKQRSDGRWTVTTPRGTINAKRVVNAAGVWARQVGLLSGISLPLIPVNHQHIVKATIPGGHALTEEMPVVTDSSGSFHLRQDGNGVLFVVNEKMKVHEDWWDSVPSAPGKELCGGDLDHIKDKVEVVKQRFPVLKDITSVSAGPICYAPDNSPLVGPYPEHYNYWVAAGFGYGISHAGGIGKFVADWMINGEPTFELIEFDPSRYGHWTTREFVIESARESFEPTVEMLTTRPMKTGAIYKYTKEKGSVYGFNTGWEVPLWFATPGVEKPIERECELALNGVGVIDFSEFGKFEVKGKDATVFLDNLIANKVPSVGVVNVSHMLTPRGRVYSEVTISHVTPNHFFIVTGDGCEYHDLRWILDHAREYNDVQVTNVTADQACISIAGPLCRELLNKVTSEDVTNKGFKFMTCRQMEVSGTPVLALRVSYTGELGWEFYVANNNAVKVYKGLMEAGEEFGIDHIGLAAVNSLRLEKAFRFWGAEMNTDVNPYQAGLDVFIKLKKEANFIGKEALLKSQKEMLDKRLVFMVVHTNGNPDAEGGEPIWLNDRVVGNTTSGFYGFQVKESVVFGYLPMYLQDVGTKVEIEIGGNRHKATVVEAPMIPMEPTRVRMAARQKK